MRALAATVAVGMALLAGGCASGDAPDFGAAVFRVSLSGCEQNATTRATAVAIGDGLALTVGHSFDDAVTATLTDVGGREWPSELVYIDRDRDIALLAFGDGGADDGGADDGGAGDGTGDLSGIETLEIRDDGDDPASEARIVVYRDDVTRIETVGLLRRISVTLDGEGRRDGIEIQGTIDRGDSGAPVVDDEGRMIGMVFASTRASDTGWAVAGSELVDIASSAGAPITLTCRDGQPSAEF